MSWKEILKVADIGMHDLKDEQYDKKYLVSHAFELLDSFYETKLKVLFRGRYDERPYWRYVASRMEEEIQKDKTLLDKLTLHLLDYYTWDNPKHLTQWSKGVDSKNSESLKEDTLAFFEEHLSQKKYVDLAREHAEYYASDLYGV
tara:strand:- start:1626 stop:2060 length:435 start_codon:yes stop_codon:yes gene_type:complete